MDLVGVMYVGTSRVGRSGRPLSRYVGRLIYFHTFSLSLFTYISLVMAHSEALCRSVEPGLTQSSISYFTFAQPNGGVKLPELRV